MFIRRTVALLITIIMLAFAAGVSAYAESAVAPAPTSISLRSAKIKMRPRETYYIDPSVMPVTADPSLTYKSSNSAVASVSADGAILAKKTGSAKITISSSRNTSIKKTISVVVAKLSPPKKLVITPSTAKLTLGETLQLTAKPSPANAASGVKWSSGNKKIATVSRSGLVTPLKAGKVKITATSTAKSSVKVSRTFTIIDPYAPTSVQINQGNLFLNIGDTEKLTYAYAPDIAVFKATWSSSNKKIVSIDQDGNIRALKPGKSVIKIKTDSGLTSQITVAVIDRQYAIAEPLRTTALSELNENLMKIDAIKESALEEIESLEKSGTLTLNSATRRKGAIESAFTMYRFPWKTAKRQNYWSSSAASKAYQPGVIYYGMPYIQNGVRGNTANRQFGVSRAVSGGYFTKSGSVYSMNHARKLNGTYVGNDCSSFVSMSIWGTKHSASFYTTRSLATTTYYKTVKGTMLPGDLLVRRGKHCVMFLYYTNTAKTHMMIIEQGGGTEPNTIASRHKEVSQYLKGGYIIRRATRF